MSAPAAVRVPASSTRACDACLRRTWLLAALVGRIELARRAKRRLPELLALPDGDLIAAVAGDRAGAIRRETRTFRPAGPRAAIAAAGLEAVCRHDDAYPERLRDGGPAAPAVLHVLGGLQRFVALTHGTCEDGPPAASIVGTRNASADGLETARALGRGLAAAGVGVVSGMALGIDAGAHGGALDAGGPTIAVLAGGADRPYPPSKRALHARIAREGCVVSELPPGFAAHRWCFPARNRVIAALGRVTLVVEAAQRSGSLITAELAEDLGRPLGAVPGPVLATQCAGTNALLHGGAHVIRDAQDALDLVLGVGMARDGGDGPDRRTLTDELEQLLSAVERGQDTVARLAPGPGEVQGALVGLTELELLGFLRRAAGGRYVRVG